MFVKDLILYQVSTDRTYKVGDKLHFEKDDNGQAHNVFTTSYNIYHTPFYKIELETEKLNTALEKYDFAIREFALEQVRVQNFPNLPSRFKCMFLTDDKKACLDNLKNYISKAYGKIYQAVAVKVCGEIFYAKDFIVEKQGLSFNDYKKQAQIYWSQNQNSNSPVKEILFIGDVEIIEILDQVELEK